MTADDAAKPRWFKKKPVAIQAIRFDSATAAKEITEWSGGKVAPHVGDPVPQVPSYLVIHTLEGSMMVNPGDWVIKGVAGEFYPCKPDIFEATYEPLP